MFLNYEKNNKQNAINLRKNMTPWERKLWFAFLKNLPVKIYTQRRIGKYILDFYCPTKKIAIELDGGQHFQKDNIIKDNDRTAFLNSKGIAVLRYNNDDVTFNFEAVCEHIARELGVL